MERLEALASAVGELLTAPLRGPDYPERFRTDPKHFVEGELIPAIRRAFAKDQEVPISVIILGNRDIDGNTANAAHMIAALGDSNMHKNLLVHVVRAAVTKLDLWSTIFFSEAWLCSTADPDGLEEWRKAHGGSIAGHPDTIEALQLMLEHPTGHSIWRAPISKNAEGVRVLGEFELTPMEGGAGRFYRILLDKEAN